MLIVFLLIAFVCVWFWLRRPGVSLHQDVLDAMDGDDTTKELGRFTPFQRNLAYEFKSEFGCLRYNGANKMVAASWVRKRLLAIEDMRACDRAHLAPLIVELCLVPLATDIAAGGFAADPAVANRRAMVGGPR